jgi:hypothetical protein
MLEQFDRCLLVGRKVAARNHGARRGITLRRIGAGLAAVEDRQPAPQSDQERCGRQDRREAPQEAI